VSARTDHDAVLGRSTRRRLSPESRRQELLDAAIRVLREQGPDSCRVEDVTCEAGTAKGNFYRYFPTWDDLLAAVRSHLLDSYREELTERYQDLSVVDWWEVVDAEIDHFVTFQLGLGGLHEAAFHGPAGQRPSEQRDSAASILAELLAAGIADGSFFPVDIETTATLLFDLLHAAADAVARGMDREAVVTTTRRIFHRTLEPT
jgi:AcrR family transcriptional regulator